MATQTPDDTADEKPGTQRIVIYLKDITTPLEYRVTSETLATMQKEFVASRGSTSSMGTYTAISKGKPATLFIVWSHIVFIG